MPFPKGINSRAGDGFATSIRGLFNSQRRKAKAYVLKTMRGDPDHDHGEWSDGDGEFRPFARQLTIAKAKKLIRRHSKKSSSRTQTSSGDLISFSVLSFCFIFVGMIIVLMQASYNILGKMRTIAVLELQHTILRLMFIS